MRRLISVALFALVVVGLPAAPGRASSAVHTPNLTHVTNLQYPLQPYPSGAPFNYAATNRQGGTDIETFTQVVDLGNGPEERVFAAAGTYRNGVQLVDVTDPANPVLAQTYPCGIAQGDVQIIERGGRTYVAYAQDDIPSQALYTTACFTEALALYGYDVPTTPGDANAIDSDGGISGTFIIDVTNPYATSGTDRVQTVGWARAPAGSHNATVDPSGYWLYNSNQDLLPRSNTEGNPLFEVEIFDLSDLTNPVKVGAVPLTTGAGPHDITFSADGTRAYAAAVSHTVVIDTTDKANPAVIGVIEDPAISIHHQADPVDMGGRSFLVVSDELAGVAQGGGACPGGGLHVYDVTGDLERTPVKVGYFAISQVAPPGQHHLRCTAHVFRFYPEQQLMTIAWYGAGVRVVDISGLLGPSVGVTPQLPTVGTGMKEIASFWFPQAAGQAGSQTWAAKVHSFDADGSAYIFANDLDRGFDVYRFDASAPQGTDPGQWLSPDEALALAQSRGVPAKWDGATPVCVIVPGVTVE